MDAGKWYSSAGKQMTGSWMLWNGYADVEIKKRDNKSRLFPHFLKHKFVNFLKT